MLLIIVENYVNLRQMYEVFTVTGDILHYLLKFKLEYSENTLELN